MLAEPASVLINITDFRSRLPGTTCHEEISLGRRILTQYGSVTWAGKRKVCQWVETFISGGTSVSDEVRSGRLSASRFRDSTQRGNAVIWDDRQITVSEVVEMLGSRRTDACNSQQKKMAAVRNCSMAVRHFLPTGGRRNNGYFSELQSSAASNLQSWPPTLRLSYIKGHYVVVCLAVMKVKEAVNKWVWEQPQTLLSSWVRTLVDYFNV
jgi:hypothetical protein